MTTTSAMSNTSIPERPPTLAFPSLHLDSFQDLESFNLNLGEPSSSSSSSRPPAQQPTRSDSRPGSSHRLKTQPLKALEDELVNLSAGKLVLDRRASDGIVGRVSSQGERSLPSDLKAVNYTRKGSLGSNTTTGERSQRLPTPSNLSLPPLPALSTTTSNTSDKQSSSGATLTSMSKIRGGGGPALTINIPSNPNSKSNNEPSSRDQDQNRKGVSPPVSSLPRRRTIIESNPAGSRASEVRVSQILDHSTPIMDYEDGIFGGEQRQRKLSVEPVIMPTALPTGQRITQQPQPQPQSQSQTSSPRRSLPRPPPAKEEPPSSSSRPIPTASTSLPPKGTPRSAPRPSLPATTNSASTLPVIGGLMDAGPYPTSNSGIKRTVNGQQQNGLGNGKPSGTGGRGGPPPEEVCLECMMRDRDLADVAVTGPGVWDRESDIAWEDLQTREYTIIKSMSLKTGGGGRMDGSVSDKEDGGGGSEESISPGSTAHSMEDAERIGAAKRKKALRKAKRREMDLRIGEAGWRGFKWEEGTAGDGLPRGFRGTSGGPLSEQGIKAVMTKFPSASAHRYNALQTYLRHQYLLVLDIAAQAKRIGYFPDPEPLRPVSDSSSSRTSSVLIETKILPRETPVLDSPKSVVRASPSTPIDLNQGTSRPPPVHQTPRPMTHFIPDREPSRGDRGERERERTPVIPISLNRPSPRGKSPGAGFGIGMDFDAEEDLYQPLSPAESGMRPFSFAVRAGAVAGRDGSEGGHTTGGGVGGGRKSMFGRWGGSVTSFFGGSQGGSGSMMDMHLGLDNDRQNRTSSYNVHGFPRAVSLASPSRPSFFSRSSTPRDMDPRGTEHMGVAPRVSTSLSASRLSQVCSTEEEPKKKGLKGFLKKIKKSRKSKNTATTSSQPPTPLRAGFDSPMLSHHPQHQQQVYSPDLSGPLAPPPNMAYLVGRGDRHRDRSGSSSSMLTDPSIIPNGREPQIRSVSAPLAGSSSEASQSVSPTSSRYVNANLGAGAPNPHGTRRESYASGRRTSGTYTYVEEDPRRASLGQALNHTGSRAGMASPDNRTGTTNRAQQARPHNKTNSSLSASSFIETPPAMSQSNFFGQPTIVKPGSANSYSTSIPNSTSTPANLSPNRFKNLPPLPPPGNESSQDERSMPLGQYDSHQVHRGSQPQLSSGYQPGSASAGGFRHSGSSNPSPRNSAIVPPLSAGAGYSNSPRTSYDGLPPHLRQPNSHSRTPSQRGSFDILPAASSPGSPYSYSNNQNQNQIPTNKNQQYNSNVNTGSRMVKSMYAQPGSSSSNMSFGGGYPGIGPNPNGNNGYSKHHISQKPYNHHQIQHQNPNPNQYQHNTPYAVPLGSPVSAPYMRERERERDEGDGKSMKSTKSRKGFKSFFGGSKAGRLA